MRIDRFRALSRMKHDRFGAVMLVAGVLVAGLIVALLDWHQVRVHRDNIRIRGVAMVRALSLVEMPRLAPAAGATSLLSTLAGVQRSDAFAYGLVVSKSGAKLFEIASPGTIVPAASMPAEPASWFGEHLLTSPGDGRKIREFFGPVLTQGELEGYVRVGYYDRPKFMPFADLSAVAVMALPIFLLTALSVFMIRREIRPLAALSERIEEASAAYGPPGGRFGKGFDLRQFTQRFDAFMALVENKVHESQQQRLDAQAAGHLLSYKHEKTEAVLNAVPDGMLVVDETCVPVFANPKVTPILGVSREELIGKEPEKWCRHKDVLAFLLQIKAEGGAAMQAENFEYSPQEQPDRRIAVWTYPLFSPRDNDTLFGMLMVFRDISQQFLARQTSLDFVSRVSHELKTPLATLSAYSELLLDYATLADAERVNAVNVIRDEVERANTLIQNMLNISRLESGTMPLTRHRVNVQDLLNDTVKTMGTRAESRNVSLKLKTATNLRPARLDKDMFRIALDNIVSNAIKYSHAGGAVTLSAEENDADELEIVTNDQGIGISAADCAKVFDKYYRGDSDQVLERSGHGLGLYLAKQIVELHHGSVSVSSELGKGSRFTIRLPLQQAQLEKLEAA